jgi:hypothetical protein
VRQVTTTKDAWEQDLRAERDNEGPRPTATGTLMRASGVLGCARQLAFAAAGIPECEEITTDTLVAFTMGQHLHERMQAAMEHDHGMQCEVPIQITENVSGNADGVYTDPDGVLTVWEAKSKSNFGFKLAMKDGPELKDCLQAAVNAIGIDAPQIHMVYVCKESDYRAGLKQGQVAEWVIDLREPFDSDGESLHNLACGELDRLERIAKAINDKVLPSRSIPGIGLIEYPPAYQAPKGAPWQCRYCQWNSICVQMPTGEVPLP